MVTRNDPTTKAEHPHRSRTVGLALLSMSVGVGIAATANLSVAQAPDAWWKTVSESARTSGSITSALLLDSLGGGWLGGLLVPAFVLALLVLAGRWRASVFSGLAFLVSAGVVQVLKEAFSRDRPLGMIVDSDHGSFPSGHVANAATLALVLFYFFPRLWVAVGGVAWATAMALSRTLLGAHWASDVIGGALVGVAVPLLLASWLLPWARLRSAPLVRLRRRSRRIWDRG